MVEETGPVVTAGTQRGMADMARVGQGMGVRKPWGLHKPGALSQIQELTHKVRTSDRVLWA